MTEAPIDALVLVPVTAIFLAGYALARYEPVQQEITCPITTTTAKVKIVRGFPRPGNRGRVKFCSLLRNPKKVACEQACLNRMS